MGDKKGEITQKGGREQEKTLKVYQPETAPHNMTYLLEDTLFTDR